MDIRSNNANSYYWGVIIHHSSLALTYAGWEEEIFSHPELVHKFWKDLFNISSTASLSKQEFNNYTENIIRVCAVYLDYVIPV